MLCQMSVIQIVYAYDYICINVNIMYVKYAYICMYINKHKFILIEG